jgi:hypothetical protein
MRDSSPRVEVEVGSVVLADSVCAPVPLALEIMECMQGSCISIRAYAIIQRAVLSSSRGLMSVMSFQKSVAVMIFAVLAE